MTTTAPAFLFCRCGHTGRRHDNGEGPCEAAACGCGTFREKPSIEHSEPFATGGEIPDTIRGVELEGPPELVLPNTSSISIGAASLDVARGRVPLQSGFLRDAARSPNEKTRRLGERIEQMLADLAGILDAESRQTAQRARLAAIEAERAKLLADLGQPRRVRAATPVDCRCGRSFGSAQARGVHAARQREQGDDNHGAPTDPVSGVE